MPGDSPVTLRLGHFGMADQIPRAGGQKTERDDAVERVRVESVAGNLLIDEAAIRLIGIEGPNDVIAIRPGVGPRLVFVVAVRLAEMHHVEPMPRPALAVLRRRQQPIDQPLESLRIRVGYERLDSRCRSAAGPRGRNGAAGLACGDRLRARVRARGLRAWPQRSDRPGCGTRPRASARAGPAVRAGPKPSARRFRRQRDLRPFPARRPRHQSNFALAPLPRPTADHPRAAFFHRDRNWPCGAAIRFPAAAGNQGRPAVAAGQGPRFQVQPQSAFLLVKPVAAEAVPLKTGRMSCWKFDRRRRRQMRAGHPATPLAPVAVAHGQGSFYFAE